MLSMIILKKKVNKNSQRVTLVTTNKTKKSYRNINKKIGGGGAFSPPLFLNVFLLSIIKTSLELRVLFLIINLIFMVSGNYKLTNTIIFFIIFCWNEVSYDYEWWTLFSLFVKVVLDCNQQQWHLFATYNKVNNRLKN